MMPLPMRPRLLLCPEGPGLALGRAHEVAGSARRVFAALTAARTLGPVLWIRGARTAPGRLDPEGLLAFFDPGRLVVARHPRGVDTLWAAEEALRSGAVPCVVVEPDSPPALTPVRRLQIAAEAGAAAAPCPPLCLILTPDGGAAGAVETRWRMDPLPGWAQGPHPGGGPARWRLMLLRDKAGPPGAWDVTAPCPATPAHRFLRTAA